MSATIPTYQRIKPCLDQRGHAFVTNGVAPGNFGYAFIYCARCGKRREQLNP